jgi:tetratricopeptide (TPR) repeat protein
MTSNHKHRWASIIELLAAVIFLVCGSSAVIGPARAQTGDGGTQSVFTLGAGSRGISLGRAFVSLADDASAIYWNPAALRNVQSKQLMGMYMPLYGAFTDATYTFLGAVYPTVNAGSLGLGFMRVGTTFEGFDAFSRPTGEGEYSESQVLLGYAFERKFGFLSGSLQSGATFKIVNQRITPQSSTSPGIDVGFRYLPDFAKPFAFGMNIQDLVGASHRLVSESDKTYRTLMAGLGYTHRFVNGSALRVMVQLDSPERADRKFHAGAEYVFSKYVALRMGMDAGNVTFGLGVNAASFAFDYAYLSRETAGSSHPVSFTTHYGPTLYERRAELAEQRAAARYQAEANLQQAIDEWKIVLEYVPGDEEALANMEELSDALLKEQEKVTHDIEKQAAISSHFSRGLDLYQENDYMRSREEWRAILVIDSTHAVARDYLGKVDEKISELVDQRIRRAEQLEAQRRYTEAVGEWNNVQSLSPGNTVAQVAIRQIRSKIESQSQDLEIAAKRLRVVSLYNQSLQAFDEGGYERAMKDLRTLLDLEPGHEEAKLLFARAKRKLIPLTAEEEAKIRGLYLMGMRYFSKDQYNEAIKEWEKILEIDPNNESVQRNIEEARQRLDKLSKRP